MKIKQIRVVNLDIPLTPPKSKSRRPAANKVSARRALPINYYPEFSTAFGNMPGARSADGGSGEVWVQVIAEDGTYGLGACSFGEPVAALIDYHYAPLLEGRDALAIEYWHQPRLRSASSANLNCRFSFKTSRKCTAAALTCPSC